MKQKILGFVCLMTLLGFTSWAVQEYVSEGAVLQAAGRWGPKKVVVMTRNIYVGANVDAILEAETEEEYFQAITEAYYSLYATNFYERALALAREIAWWRPHLVGIQEASIIRTQSPGDFLIGNPFPAEDVLFDYLEILEAALLERGLDYYVAGKVQNADIEVPFINPDTGSLDDIRLTDFDVVLARADVETNSVDEVSYNDYLEVTGPIPGLIFPIYRGYVSLKAKVGRMEYRFVNTHLEPFHPLIKQLQAEELLDAVEEETLPAILVGDFNTPVPADQVYQTFLLRGYVDTWLENKVQRDPMGFTSGFDSWLDDPNDTLEERIDLIFVRNNPLPNMQAIGPVIAFVVGEQKKDRTPSGLWPSDHAGVIARLKIPK
ncbi:MAG: endonuclease/exonuclease/phosphatase family protein [Candidatus Aminicenantes bacterium]|jgi:hypothetical protein